MADRAWKRVEREVARILGGRRIPVPGRQGPAGDPGDVEDPRFYVEVRARKSLSLLGWFRELRAAAAAHARPPLLVMKEPRRGGELLAVLRLRDLAEVLHAQDASRAPGPAGPDPGPAPGAGGGGGGDGADPPGTATYAGWCWFCRRTGPIIVRTTHTLGPAGDTTMIHVAHTCQAGHELLRGGSRWTGPP